MPLDVRARAVAEDLTAAHPAWLVVWGTYWRCWSAFARFGPGPLVLHETSANVLAARMREAELAVRMRMGW